MALATQVTRSLRVSCPLGDDALLFRRMTAVERVSRPFSYELEALSENAEINGDQLLGQPLVVAFDLPGEGRRTRYFNGYISAFSFLGLHDRYAHYGIQIRPWLWFLTRSADCRIFQNKTAPEIIKQVFQGRGFSEFLDRLTGSYRCRDYCVQYRESDFNFVSRLMEEEGIHYFFDHSAEKHTLILADVNTPLQPVSGYAEVPYFPEEQRRERDHVSQWLLIEEAKSGKWSQTDYNFETPRANLESTLSRPAPHALSAFEIYDYPGGYRTSSEGTALSRVRLEEIQADGKLVRGSGNAAGLAAGHSFMLTQHPRRDQNGEYHVLETTIDLVSDRYASGGGGETICTCAFVAIPARTPFRPARRTPKPFVQGPQTAVVTGPAGEEIHTDKYGRVKVQFHWDREGKHDQDSSCWIRVGTPWAGKTWGAISIPRIGQEVIVDFLEGDPDQPIILGSLYNAAVMPPLKLPDEKAKSGVKSYSTKGGGGYNALRFDDTKGSEQVLLHAQHELHLRAGASAFETVGEARHLTVGGNQLEQVKGSKHLTVNGDQNEKIDGTVSQQVGMDLQQKVGMKHALDAGMEVHLKAGMNIVLEAGMSITLKAGGGFIVVGPAGVTISGMPVLINSGGAAGSGSGCSPDAATAPQEATKWEPGQAMEAPPPPRPAAPPPPPPPNIQAQALRRAAESGTPFCEKCEEARRQQQGGG